MRLPGYGIAVLLVLHVALAGEVYFNDFNGPLGSAYPEWTSTGFRNTANAAATVPGGAGPQPVSNTDSANTAQRFLGEFGGPRILPAPPYDPQHFVDVTQTVTLTLPNLTPHSTARVEFDLYVLKSWDGKNPNYGPDRWSLRVEGGSILLDAAFSNNFKTRPYDLSLQDYPHTGSPPQSGAIAANTLGYKFFGDSVYHLSFSFPHNAATLVLHFSSSLFEGKGVEDESWGLDNVRVSTGSSARSGASAAPGEK